MEFISPMHLPHPSHKGHLRRRAAVRRARQISEDFMTLQAKLDTFKADFEAGKPPYSVPRSVID
jgi:hypothetical protein